MANYRTTVDVKAATLQRAGELTDGNSSYDDLALTYMNEAYQGVIAGNSEFAPEIAEDWLWARSKYPLLFELQPSKTNTIILTEGDRSASFGTAITDSVTDWFVKIDGRSEYFRIAAHTAGATACFLDQPYTDDSGTLACTIIKLDYQLADDTIVVDGTCNKIDFKESSGASILTATVTNGVYTPSTLATELKTQLEAAGAETYTVSFDTDTRKFTVAHGGAYLSLLQATGTYAANSLLPKLGFDQTDLTGAVTYTATNSLNAILKICAPFTIYGTEDKVNLLEKFSLTSVSEGIPNQACIIEQNENGIVTIRVNKYPTKKTRVEAEWIARPLDLQNNVYSVPIIPFTYRQILADFAAFMILKDKNDDKANEFLAKGQAKLKAMQNYHRGFVQRNNPNFGRIITRPTDYERNVWDT